MRCNNNHLRIRKMISRNNELVMPDENEEFSIRVESCSSRRHYRLNQCNHFCVELDLLSDEEVCVYEDNGGDYVRFEIDGENSESGCVDFLNSNFHEIIIINESEDCSYDYGSLRLRKYIVNRCGEEHGVAQSFSFEMIGENYHKIIHLNAENQYTALIQNIPYGNYEVRELNHGKYDVSYVVNGIESDYGNIEIDSNYGEMMIYNRRNDENHILRIDKWISENGKLRKPMYPDNYVILLNDGYAMREYTLNCGNRYSVSVEGNRNDTFMLEEMNASNVIYELDGEIVDHVEMTMSKDHELRIINTQTSENKGTILLQKWMDEDGSLVVPSSHMSFDLRLLGYSDVVYTLNNSNHFTLRFDDIEEGYYQISEVDDAHYDVSYEVNGIAQEDGYIYVRNGEITNVSIINRERSEIRSTLHLMKRVGIQNLEIPEEGNFDVYVEGVNGAQHVMLNADNHYEMYLEVENGWYTIYEVNPSGNVVYRLDGVDHNEDLYFYVEDFDHEVVIINSKQRINYII